MDSFRIVGGEKTGAYDRVKGKIWSKNGKFFEATEFGWVDYPKEKIEMESSGADSYDAPSDDGGSSDDFSVAKENSEAEKRQEDEKSIADVEMFTDPAKEVAKKRKTDEENKKKKKKKKSAVKKDKPAPKPKKRHVVAKAPETPHDEGKDKKRKRAEPAEKKKATRKPWNLATRPIYVKKNAPIIATARAQKAKTSGKYVGPFDFVFDKSISAPEKKEKIECLFEDWSVYLTYYGFNEQIKKHYHDPLENTKEPSSVGMDPEWLSLMSLRTSYFRAMNELEYHFFAKNFGWSHHEAKAQGATGDETDEDLASLF